MASRHQRSNARMELRTNVRRAREFAQRYGLDDAHPAEYIEPIGTTTTDFDDLLSRIK